MNDLQGPVFDNEGIISQRGLKNSLDLTRPYDWLVEKEISAEGINEDTGIIFLSNKECSFKCLMCDLWKNTSDFPTPVGTIPEQIRWALSKMPASKHLKLYNSGSFFDNKAIPESDDQAIADLVQDFETIIVESHPNLIGDRCLRFKDMLNPDLEVAIGLETVHREVLKKLNKKMTLEDFQKAVSFLTAHGIQSRAFILLRPPFMSESEGVYWAKRSIDFAFDCGVSSCTIIPVRGGNGAMEVLGSQGNFNPPGIKSLEEVHAYGLELKAGRVFSDLWDLELFSDCSNCFEERRSRLEKMNLQHKVTDKLKCLCF